MDTIYGDCQAYGDTEISVEPYDRGLILLSFEVAGERYPIEMRSADATNLIAQLTQAVRDTGDESFIEIDMAATVARWCDRVKQFAAGENPDSC